MIHTLVFATCVAGFVVKEQRDDNALVRESRDLIGQNRLGNNVRQRFFGAAKQIPAADAQILLQLSDTASRRLQKLLLKNLHQKLKKSGQFRNRRRRTKLSKFGRWFVRKHHETT